MDFGSFSSQGNPELCYSSGTLEGVRLVPVRRGCGNDHKRKVILTDASNSGWGTLYEGRPVFGLWTAQGGRLHINCLKLKAVENALGHFLTFLKGHNVLVRMDNMAVVSYVNRQVGLRSRSIHALAEPPRVVSAQPALANAGVRAGLPQRVSGHAVQRQHSPRVMVPAPSGSPTTVEQIWESGNRSLCVVRECALPNIFHKKTSTCWPTAGPATCSMRFP